jgi:hypothetical protein
VVSLRRSFTNVDPNHHPPHPPLSNDVSVISLGRMEISQNPELKIKLTNFLSSHSSKPSSALDTSLKRKQSSEPHWTTDNENIVHQDRIGCGGLGDVHQVLRSRGDW